MKSKLQKINQIRFLLVFVLILAFIFRFYKLHDWLIFGMDQENELFIIQNIVKNSHFPAIGLSAGDTGVYRGPFFLYLSVIPFILFKGNPIGGSLTASLIGVFVTYFIFLIAKKMFNRKVGIIAAFLYSSSFLAAFYDRQFWNPVFAPLLSLCLGYLIFKILKGQTRLFPWLILFFGISTHSHLSLLVFSPLIIFAAYVRRKQLTKKIILFSLSFLILSQSTLIFFDMRHGFQNTRKIISLISGKKDSNRKPSSAIERTGLFLTTIGRFYWTGAAPDLFVESGQCSELQEYRKIPPIPITIMVFFLLAVSVLKIRSHSKESSEVIVGVFMVTVLSVLFFGRQMFEYQWGYFFPWLSIMLSLPLVYFWERNGKIFVTVFLSIFFFLNILTLFSAKYSYSYKDKILALSFAKGEIKGKSYSLEALGECGRFGGYRYLSEYLIGKAPLHSYMDSYFGWLYKEQVSLEKPEIEIIFSLIDPRDTKSTVSRWEQEKTMVMKDNKVLFQKRFDKIQVIGIEK